eukprot:5095569-Prymnesium_polylepis.2
MRHGACVDTSCLRTALPKPQTEIRNARSRSCLMLMVSCLRTFNRHAPAEGACTAACRCSDRVGLHAAAATLAARGAKPLGSP